MTRVALLSTSDEILLAALSSDADYTLVNLRRLQNTSALTRILGSCDVAIVHSVESQRDRRQVLDITRTLVPRVLAVEEYSPPTEALPHLLTVPADNSVVGRVLAGESLHLARLHELVSAAVASSSCRYGITHSAP